MSDKHTQEEDDENAILLEDVDGDSHKKQNIQINAADEEMLLLSSSPSPPSSPSAIINVNKTISTLNAGPSGVKKTSPVVHDLNTSTSNIIIEDSSSESEGGSSMDSNSVEVIDSEEEDEMEEEESDSDESIGAYLDGKVQIFMAHGSFFIWNAEDVHMLREECRIVGKLVGCLPRAPRQNNQLGLPLQLMPEEAKLLEEIEAGCVVEEVEAVPDDIKALRKASFQAMRKDNYNVQKRLYKENRKVEVLQHKNEIMQGREKAKKRKIQQLEKNCNSNSEGKSSKSPKNGSSKSKETLSDDKDDKSKDQMTDSERSKSQADDLDADAKTESGSGIEIGKSDDGEGLEPISPCQNDGVADSSLTRITGDAGGLDNDDDDAGGGGGNNDDSDGDGADDDFNVDKLVSGETHVKHSLVQLFTENPWKENVKRPKHWIFPLSQKEFLRYEVFRDLWKKGYFLTSGSKFGGDFLVYPGDPARFHSHFIAVCIDKTVDLSALDIISLGRLGSNVRKTVLLCAFDGSRQIAYTSLQWTGMR